MLTPYDRDFAAGDPEIPGLAALFDDSVFAEALGQALAGQTVGPARATYVRYKPGTNCVVLYETSINNEKTFVYAKAFRRGSSKLSSAGRHASPGDIVLEGHDVLARVFPHDYKLKELYRLFDPGTRREVLAELLPGSSTEDVKLQGLRYKPERRYVAKLTAPDGKKAVLKAYTGSGYAAAKAGAGIQACVDGDLLRLPGLLGASERCSMLAFEWLEGRKLSEALLSPGLQLSGAEASGAALSELHSRRISGLRRLTREEEAGGLIEVAAGLSGLLPRISDKALALAEDLAGAALEMPSCENPVHGDFYADQVLYDGRRAGIVDLDRASLGDPAFDIGNFLAHLEREVLRGSVERGRAERISRAFIDGYRAFAGAVPIERTWFYTASGLLKLSAEPFRFREPGWPEKVEAMVERAAEMAEVFTGKKTRNASSAGKKFSGPPVKVEDPFSVADDPALAFVADAMDPEVFSARLEDCLSYPFLEKEARGEIRIGSIRVVRHKPGRRALLEYGVASQTQGGGPEDFSLLGKVNAKGLRGRAYTLQGMLWRNGFGPESRVSVPEPVGAIPEFHMWLQRKVQGETAASALSSDRGAEKLAERIAEAAYKLHSCGVRAGRAHTAGDELRILEERLGLFARENPGRMARIEKILDACRALAGAIPHAPAAGIHRDFYPDQVIVSGPERLFIVDLDLYCEGDPALDIGNFIAHLSESALRTAGDAGAFSRIEEAMVERYVELAGPGLRFRIDAYKTLSIARHIHISTLFPDRKPFAGALMEVCEQRLGVLCK